MFIYNKAVLIGTNIFVIYFIVLFLIEIEFIESFSSEILILKNDHMCNKSEFFSVNNLKCGLCDPAKNLILSTDSKH